MSPERLPLPDRISPLRAALAVAFVCLAAVAFAVTTRPVDPVLVGTVALAAAFFVASTFDAVREHPLFSLLSSAVVGLLFAGWWVTAEKPAPFPAAMAVLLGLGVIVELYNLHTGSTYLRLDW